jgi:phosphosulfolactate synthase
MKRAFSTIEIPNRPAKPRTKGMTMMVDWGLPPGAQRDMLGFASEFIDLAKVAIAISGLISEDALVQKISAYHEAGVEPFPGGMFVELAYKQGKVPQYYEECRRVGYHLIEVSDNVVHFSRQVRERLIRQAVEEYGFRVLGEVGSKHVETDPQTLITDIKDSLVAGAWKVLVEAAEFVSEDGLDTSLVETLLGEVNPADLMFELPGKWIANVHGHQIYRMMIWLVEHVGPDVNIGNVVSEDIVPLETLRTGVGVTMKL